MLASGAVLFMRSVRVLPGETEFVSQTAVIMQEAFQFCNRVTAFARKRWGLKLDVSCAGVQRSHMRRSPHKVSM